MFFLSKILSKLSGGLEELRFAIFVDVFPDFIGYDVIQVKMFCQTPITYRTQIWARQSHSNYYWSRLVSTFSYEIFICVSSLKFGVYSFLCFGNRNMYKFSFSLKFLDSSSHACFEPCVWIIPIYAEWNSLHISEIICIF